MTRFEVLAEYLRGVVSTHPACRAQRRLTRQDQPDLFVTCLGRVRRWTGRMDWSTREVARAALEATNAFVDANDAEDRGLQLLDPVPGAPAIISR